MDSNPSGREGNPAEFISRSRVLALIVAIGSIALVALVLVLPFTMEHALEGTQLLLWGSILLIVTLIVGISLVYVYVSKSVPEGAAVEGPRPREEVVEHGEEATLRLLPEDERAIYRRLVHEGGQVLQKDLRRMVPFSGPKLTRVLDRLERKGLVVRERRGMTNLVRLIDGDV